MIDPVPEVQPLDIQPLAPPAPPRRNLFYRIFVGPRGVRAGWKVALFFLLVGGITMCFVPIVKMMPEAGRGAPVPPGIAFVQELAGAAAVVIATWIMARWIDRKPFGYFGMPLRNALRSTFWTGAVVGLGALALQLEIMHLAGWFDFGTLQLHGAAIVTYGAAWAAVFFCVGITEEGVLRGYVQRVTTDGLSRLPRGWSFWASALIFSVVFGAGHLSNPGENKFGIVMVFVDGLAMCFSLWRTGNLWFAIGNHAAWDWGETFLFGTPNSGFHGQHALMTPSFHGPTLLAGGTDGPEGSVLALLSEAIFILSVAVIYRRRKYALLQDEEEQLATSN
ncbi:MAG: CPBP family intramembrane glutamic endopeptidase [Candidatus Korobacteraceae bacterium]